MNIEKNSLHEITVTDINNRGYGVGRIDGKVVFVSGGVTGERLRVKIIKVASDYLVARCEEVLLPSPHRLIPSCEVATRCGGCVYQQITYAHELELKKAAVQSAFKKAGLTDTEVLPVLSTGKAEGYRNKVECPIDSQYRIGFYAERSHEIIPHNRCLLQEVAFDGILEFVAKTLQAKGIRGVRNIYLRYGAGTGEIMVCLVARKPHLFKEKELAAAIRRRFPAVVSVILNYNPDDTNVILGKECRTLSGKSTIDDILCGLRFTLHPLSFYQVNHDAAELLYRTATALADLKPDETLVDLFCGVGSIGLSMLRYSGAKSLLGVEIIPEAVENAANNAAQNGIVNASFICGAAESVPFGEADVLVLDPPRKGCQRELISYIVAQGIKRIVYISCNPDTLARDVALFRQNGYAMSAVQPIDLFPRTGHVETVALLSREKADDYVRISVHTKNLKTSMS